MCRSYQCAWSQGLFTADLRPDLIGLMVSVEVGQEGQFLKVIQTKPTVDQRHVTELIMQMRSLGVKYVFVEYRDVGTIDGQVVVS